MSFRRKLVDTYFKNLSENEDDIKNNILRIILNIPQLKHLSNQLKTQLKKTQECPLQITDSSYSDILTEQRQHPSLVVQQLFSEVFSSEQTQAENERLRIQNQKKSRLQINSYKNKNCNVINCYNKRNNVILKFKMMILFQNTFH